MSAFECVRADGPAAAVETVNTGPRAACLAGGTTQLNLILKDGVIHRSGLSTSGCCRREIGVVGVSAAIANTVYHATGRRIRSLPVRPTKEGLSNGNHRGTEAARNTTELLRRHDSTNHG